MPPKFGVKGVSQNCRSEGVNGSATLLLRRGSLHLVGFVEEELMLSIPSFHSGMILSIPMVLLSRLVVIVVSST